MSYYDKDAGAGEMLCADDEVITAVELANVVSYVFIDKFGIDVKKLRIRFVLDSDGAGG